MDKCPSCDRSFEGLRDFPLVYISSFRRIVVPSLIGSSHCKLHPETKSAALGNLPIPGAVLELFRESGRKAISYEGMVYRRDNVKSSDGMTWYERSEDVTEIVREALKIPEITGTLSDIEKLFVGKESNTKNILSLSGFAGRFRVRDYADLQLAIYDTRARKEGLREANICLNGGWGGGSVSSASISVDLAELVYEGRVRRGLSLV